MGILRWILLAVAVAAVLAPGAHLLELPNKLALDGKLWLAVQQTLYRGWGPFIGAPTQIAGLALSLILAAWPRTRRRWPWLCAGAAYAAMIGVFFVFNAPVNAAVAGWTAGTLPADWEAYRWQWETGHAVSAFLSFTALFAVLRGCFAARRVL
ncbi:MAG: anthrone oxygenase family protein [Alphaproteobacteria bacterium]